METAGDVLLPSEAEAYVEHLEPFDLKDIGSSRLDLFSQTFFLSTQLLKFLTFSESFWSVPDIYIFHHSCSAL
jgi:hypothetical protein